MSTTLSQLFPPPPAFTPTSLIDLSQKVYILTHAPSPHAHALAKILYTLHATLYLGASTPDAYSTAAERLKQECKDSKGTLKPFVADMADLATLKPAVERFLRDEWRLDVLFLNDGGKMPAGSGGQNVNAGGCDTDMGVNCLAPFLLATLLGPRLAATASHFCHPNPSIRVIWVSTMLSLGTPAGGVQFDDATGAPKQLRGPESYMQSKAGVYFLATEFARRQGDVKGGDEADELDRHTLRNSNPSGVQHVVVNPGFTAASLQSSLPAPLRGLASAVAKRPEFGAYTELYAGLGPDVRSGDFVVPWGRKGDVPTHIKDNTNDINGGKSVSKTFYEWCEGQVQPYV
ncbi:NAD(P)-binding protein [Pyrenochaeta sp. DS3sAY3a]|nr:NAD(P)-binding protein [Pyrenochaeta sp. DS3sAY3a]